MTSAPVRLGCLLSMLFVGAVTIPQVSSSQVMTTYDARHQLIAVKNPDSRQGGSDIKAMYAAEGRVSDIAFGDGYKLHFRYEGNVQYINDPSSNSVVRRAVTPRQYLTVSTNDRGRLIEHLRRVETAFAKLGPADGLNAPAVPSTKPAS